MTKAGEMKVDIIADSKQAQKESNSFFQRIQQSGQRLSNTFKRLNPFQRLEQSAKKLQQSAGKSLDSLPNRLKPFQQELAKTEKELKSLQKTGDSGSRSLDQLADSAVKASVGLEKMDSVSDSGKEAVKVIQNLNQVTKETQLAVLGLSKNGEVKISAEEAEQQLVSFQQEIADTRSSLEKLRDSGDFSSYFAGMEVLEQKTKDVQRAMVAASKGGSQYVKMINDLGVSTQHAANQAAIAMEGYRDKFMLSVDRMNAKVGQAQKMTDILPEVSHIQAVDKAFLSIGNRLEETAKKGTAANLALTMLGPNASMKDLFSRIQLINQGIARFQALSLAAVIAVAAFTAGMYKLARGPQVSEVLDQQKQALQQYTDALKQRKQEIYDFAGLFEEVAQKAKVSGKKLMDNLKGQVDTLRTWSSNLKILAKRGVDEGLIAELQKLGPSASNEIRALTKMTDSQLNQYVALWREKHRLARTQAVSELAGLKKETDQKIKELQDSLTPLGISVEKSKNTWLDALQPFIQIWGLVASKVVDATTQIAVFLQKLNQLNPAITQLAGMFLYLFTVMVLLLSPMAIGIGRANGMAAAFTVLFNSVKPLVLGFLRVAGMASVIAGALVILGGTFIALWRNSENFRNSLINGWNQIKQTILTAVQPLIPSLQQLGQAFLDLINAMVGGDGNTAASFWTQLGDNIARVINFIVTNGVPLLKGAIDIVVAVLKGLADTLTAGFQSAMPVIQNVANFIRGIFAIASGDQGTGTSILQKLGLSPDQIAGLTNVINQIKAGFTAVFTFLEQKGPAIGAIISAAFQLISSVISAVVPVIAQVIGFLYPIIEKVLIFIWPIVVAIVQSAWASIQAIITSGIAIISNIIALVQNLWNGNFRAAWENIKAIFVNALIFIWNYINLVLLARVLSIFRGFGSSAVGLFSRIWASISSGVSNFLARIAAFFTTRFAAIRSTVTTALNVIRSVASTAWAAITRVITTAMARVGSVISRGFATARNAVASAASGIRSLLSGLASQAVSWGSNLISMFISGIKSKIGAVASVAKSVAGTVSKFMKWSSPTEAGPGKDSDHWAPNLMNMFTDGIKAGIPKLQSMAIKAASQLEVMNTGVAIPTIGSNIGSSTLQTIPATFGGVNVYIENFNGTKEDYRKLAQTLDEINYQTKKSQERAGGKR